MPCQASWHFEAIKLQASVHSVGADFTVAGGAFVGMMSAAQASAVHAMPVTASNAAPQATPSDENNANAFLSATTLSEIPQMIELT